MKSKLSPVAAVVVALVLGLVSVTSFATAVTPFLPRDLFRDSVIGRVQRWAMTTSVPVTITITSPSTDPANTAGRTFTVSGTTAGLISTVTFSLSPSSVTGSCAVGSGTFSCSVALVDGDDDDQTITVSANSGASTDTNVLKAPTWDLQPGATTVADLSDTLLVNAGANAMTLAYKCIADSTNVSQGSSWTCRDSAGTVVDTLALTGSGTDPVVTSTTPWGASHATIRGVQCQGGKYYLGTVNGLGALGTNDVAIEAVYSMSGTSNEAVIGDKGGDTAATAGWRSYVSSTNNNTWRMADGTNQTSPGLSSELLSAVLGEQRPGHVMAFIDADVTSVSGSYLYGPADAVVRGGAAALGSITSSGALAICALPGGTQKSAAATIYELRVWKCSGCMGGNTQNLVDFLEIKKRREAIAFGYAPRTIAAASPTTLSRSTTAYEDVDGYLYAVNQVTPRVARRSSTSSLVNEPSVSNIWDFSIDSTNAAWTKTNCASTNGATGPDLAAQADTLESTDGAGTVEHLVSQAQTLTASTWSFSVYAKKPSGSSATHAWLRDATIANGVAWFNLSTCAAATTQAGVTTYTESLADGWCRFGIIFTGTAASHTLGVGWSTADNTLTYDDGTNAQADLAIWQGDLVVLAVPTSPIVTASTSSVSRSADDLRWSSATIWSGTSVTTDLQIRCPNFDVATQATPFSLGTSTDKLKTSIMTTDLHLAEIVTSSSTQTTINGGVDVADGSSHKLRTSATTNNAEVWTDTTSIGTDASLTMPSTSSSFIYYGTNSGTALAAPCVIERSRIWLDTVTPTEAP